MNTVNKYVPERLFISPQALTYPMTDRIIENTKSLNPDVQIVYLKTQTPELPSGLNPLEKYKYIKGSLVICARTSNYMEVFASPGDISENLGIMGKLHYHCALQCYNCYLDISGRGIPWVRVYVDLDNFYAQAVKERLEYSLIQSLWSAVSFYLKTPLEKVPSGFKEICDKIIRNEILLKRSKITSSSAAQKYLKDNFDLFFRKMGLRLKPKERNALNKKIPDFFKMNSKYPLKINISEYTDILGLDHITNVMEELMKLVQIDPHFRIKLRTKSANIQNLLKYDGKNQVEITFSLNTKFVSDNFEKDTSDFGEMISAINELQKKGGYKIQIAFEPIIKYEGYMEDYLSLIKRVKNEIDLSAISKIKIGAVRYKTILKNYIQKVHSGSDILSNQELMEPEKGDKRWRYSKKDRVNIYSVIKNELQGIKGLRLGLASEDPEIWDALKLNKHGIHDNVVYQYRKSKCIEK